MKLPDIIARCDELIKKADEVLVTTYKEPHFVPQVKIEQFNEFRSLSLSFLKKVFKTDHPFYTEFEEKVKTNKPSDTELGRGIIKAAKNEIQSGWLFEIKDFITAEIFSDFLEMSDYLLNEGYKDPAAVMVGSVLEEHLRKMCDKNNITTTFTDRNGDLKNKKADSLNADLSNSNIYNKLDQKNITAWLDLRNKAAHGNYNEYTSEQVKNLHLAVSEFISRFSI